MIPSMSSPWSNSRDLSSVPRESAANARHDPGAGGKADA